MLGRGNYVDDLSVPGMLHAAMLRSPHAHARILSIDAERARGLPGVAAVVTCLEAMELCDPMPDFGPAPELHAWRCMASDKVRFVGEPVAAIVASSRYVAEDARDLIEVEYEILEPVVDARGAMEPSAPLVHEGLSSNVAIDSTLSYGDLDAAFANAALVVRDHFYWGRTGGRPARDRWGRRELRPGDRPDDDPLELGRPHELPVPAREGDEDSRERLDLHPHPAGGSFGSKFWAVQVNVLAGMLSKVVGRPVKYVEDRLDNLSCCDHHSSQRSYDIELAVAADGTFTGLRLDVVDDYGAYIQFGLGTHGNAMAQVIGPYRIEAIEYRARGVFTNKCQQGAYREFGSEVHNFVLERIVDLAARELGEDPVELRRRNFIKPSSSLQDPRRQRVRQRRLRGGARQGARARRPSTLAARAGTSPQGRSPHRHRSGHVPGAQRLRGERMVVLRSRQGHLRLERPREHYAQRRRHRRHHGDAVLDRLLG